MSTSGTKAPTVTPDTRSRIVVTLGFAAIACVFILAIIMETNNALCW